MASNNNIIDLGVYREKRKAEGWAPAPLPSFPVIHVTLPGHHIKKDYFLLCEAYIGDKVYGTLADKEDRWLTYLIELHYSKENKLTGVGMIDDDEFDSIAKILGYEVDDFGDDH